MPGKYMNIHISEHRYVMELHLGRRLSREEHVHHKNGDQKDNRLENLELCTNAADHYKSHRIYDHDLMERLYLSGLSLALVAEQMGASRSTVRTVVRERGVSRSRSAAAALMHQRRKSS